MKGKSGKVNKSKSNQITTMAPEPQPASQPDTGTNPQSTQSQSEGEGQRETPASPPLPARHTALTPGPRASRFQTTLDSALSHTLAKISWDNFAACYPHIATNAPATLRAVQSQMVDRLRSLCKVRKKKKEKKKNPPFPLFSEKKKECEILGSEEGFMVLYTYMYKYAFMLRLLFFSFFKKIKN